MAAIPDYPNYATTRDSTWTITLTYLTNNSDSTDTIDGTYSPGVDEFYSNFGDKKISNVETEKQEQPKLAPLAIRRQMSLAGLKFCKQQHNRLPQLPVQTKFVRHNCPNCIPRAYSKCLLGIKNYHR